MIMNDQTEYLFNLVSNHEKFLDELGVPFVRFESNNHYEIWAVRSHEYLEYLKAELFKQYQLDVGKAKVQLILDYVENQCKASNKTIRLYVRIAMKDNAIYYDLCNKDWQIVKIDNSGWKIINNPPILF